MIGRREFITVLGGVALTWAGVALTQEQKRYTLAHFSAGPASPPELWAVFVEALHDLGLVEGKNITFERRYAE